MHPVSPPLWSSYNPVWTPNGLLAFLVDDTAGMTSIDIVKPDGTGLRRVPAGLPGAQPMTQLAWGSASVPAAAC
jgi:hypothetical protein